MKILETIIGFFTKIFDFAGSVGDVVGGALGGINGDDWKCCRWYSVSPGIGEQQVPLDLKQVA